MPARVTDAEWDGLPSTERAIAPYFEAHWNQWKINAIRTMRHAEQLLEYARSVRTLAIWIVTYMCLEDPLRPIWLNVQALTDPEHLNYLGMSRPTAQRALRVLEELGLILRDERQLFDAKTSKWFSKRIRPTARLCRLAGITMAAQCKPAPAVEADPLAALPDTGKKPVHPASALQQPAPTKALPEAVFAGYVDQKRSTETTKTVYIEIHSETFQKCKKYSTTADEELRTKFPDVATFRERTKLSAKALLKLIGRANLARVKLCDILGAAWPYLGELPTTHRRFRYVESLFGRPSDYAARAEQNERQQRAQADRARIQSELQKHQGERFLAPPGTMTVTPRGILRKNSEGEMLLCLVESASWLRNYLSGEYTPLESAQELRAQQAEAEQRERDVHIFFTIHLGQRYRSTDGVVYAVEPARFAYAGTDVRGPHIFHPDECWIVIGQIKAGQWQRVDASPAPGHPPRLDQESKRPGIRPVRWR